VKMRFPLEIYPSIFSFICSKFNVNIYLLYRKYREKLN